MNIKQALATFIVATILGVLGVTTDTALAAQPQAVAAAPSVQATPAAAPTAADHLAAAALTRVGGLLPAAANGYDTNNHWYWLVVSAADIINVGAGVGCVAAITALLTPVVTAVPAAIAATGACAVIGWNFQDLLNRWGPTGSHGLWVTVKLWYGFPSVNAGLW